MKLTKIATLIAASASLFFTANAWAAANGLYLGGDLGYGALDASSGNVFPFDSSTASSGLAGRVFGGYQVNKYFAVESGYSFQEDGLLESTTQQGIDLEAKGMLPLTNRLSLIGKLGGAYVDQSGPGSGDKVRPLYGLGAGYDLTPHLNGTFEWTRIIGSGSTLDSDYLMAGLAYHFR